MLILQALSLPTVEEDGLAPPHPPGKSSGQASRDLCQPYPSEVSVTLGHK